MAGAPSIPYPWNIVHIYVADLENNRIVRINTMNGVGWYAFGSSGSGINQFNGPWRIFVEPKKPIQSPFDFGSGFIYVTDYGNNRVVRMNDITGAGWTTLGTQGSGAMQFDLPAGLHVAWDHPSIPPKRRIFVADSLNHRIVRFDDMNGSGWTSLGTQGNGVKQFNVPRGIHVDLKGRIYVADGENHRLVRMDDMSGAGWTTVGTQGTGVKQFLTIIKVAVDSADRIYVTDAGTNRIVRMYDMTGAGWSTFGTFGDGANEFNGPAGIHVAFPQIYATDFQNNRIARIDYFNGPGWKALGTLGSGNNQFHWPWDIFVG